MSGNKTSTTNRMETRMKAYHGTNERFKNFEPAFCGEATNGLGTEYGFFFTDSKVCAQYWAINATDKFGGEPTILECELNFEDALEVDALEIDTLDLAQLCKDALDYGNDAVIVRNANDDDSGELSTIIIVFDTLLIQII